MLGDPRRTILRVSWITWTLLFVAVFSNRVDACQFAIPILCQAYSNADAVFIGKLVKVERIESSPFLVGAHFEVKKTYKGAVASIETVKFSAGCGPDLSGIGEDYFVFKDEPYNPLVANLTSKLSDYASAVTYAENLSPKKPTFSVRGRMDIAKDDMKRVAVAIHHGTKSYNVPIDQHGFFDFTTKKEATYTVRISLPFSASIMMEDLGAYYDIVESDTISYTVSFRPNGCNYRTFQVTKPHSGSAAR